MNQINDNKKALKSGVWYTVSNFLVRSIGFITTPIFVRLLSKEEYGAFNNYTSWLSIVSVFITLNLHSTLISARYDYEDKFDEYIFSMLGLSSLTSIIGFSIVNLFPMRVVSFFNMDLKYINAMLVYLMFLPAITMFQTKKRYYFEYRKTVVTSVFLTVSTALLSVCLVIILPNKLIGRVAGSIIPTVVLGFVFYIYFLKKGKKIKIAYWKYAFPICIPYIPHLLSAVVLNSTDRVMITKFCGNEQTALYSLAYNCGAIVTMLISSLNSAFLPWMAKTLKEEKYKEINKFSVKYVATFFSLVIGIMLFSPEILLVLGGKDYIESVYVLAPVSMGCCFQFLYTMFVNVEQYYKKTIGMATATVFAAAINFVLNYIFIPRVGYLAAAYTTLIGYVCLLLFHFCLVYNMGKIDVLNCKFIMLSGLIGILIMIIITMLYSNLFIRYIVLCGYLLGGVVIVLKNRDTAKKMLKNMIK